MLGLVHQISLSRPFRILSLSSHLTLGRSQIFTIISSLSLYKPLRAVDAAGNLPLVGVFLWVLLCCHVPIYTTFLTPGFIPHFVHKETYHPPTRISAHFHALTVFILADNGAKPDWSHVLFEFSGVGDGSHQKVVVE